MRTKEKIMPKVKINDKKGVHTVPGAGVVIESFVSPAINFARSFNRIYIAGIPAPDPVDSEQGVVTSSFNDSAKTYILGGTGGESIGLPAMTTANIGFTTKLIITGALQSALTGTAAQDADRFLLAVLPSTPNAKQAKVSTTNNHIFFNNGGADATDSTLIEIEYIDANKAIVFGATLT